MFNYLTSFDMRFHFAGNKQFINTASFPCLKCNESPYTHQSIINTIISGIDPRRVHSLYCQVGNSLPLRQIWFFYHKSHNSCTNLLDQPAKGWQGWKCFSFNNNICNKFK